MSVHRSVPRLHRAVLPAALALIAGCSAAGAPDTEPTGRTVSLADLGHVHAVAFDPVGDGVLLGTHTGLLRVGVDGSADAVGPVLDLMGFTVAAPDRFLASGHPGLRSDLPQPMGLIESTDGGRSWQPVSRQGVSDFHALAATPDRVLGYDGSLVSSADGSTWTELAIPAPPATLALSTDGARALATSAEGPLISEDGGGTWAPLSEAPLLQVADFAGAESIVGVDPAGQVWLGDEETDGWAWRKGADLAAAPIALDADAPIAPTPTPTTLRPGRSPSRRRRVC